MAFEELDEIFEFSSATDVIDKYLDESPKLRAGDPLRDLLHFSAADAALIPAMVEPENFSLPLSKPVVVTERDARLAVLATDCNPFRWDHDLQSPRLWDAGFFAADISKIAMMSALRIPAGGGESLAEVSDPRGLIEMIQAIEERYLKSSTEVEQAFGKSGLVRLRGVLWLARLSVHVRPETARSEIESAVRELRLSSRGDSVL
jgi:hypothetical protein